MLSCGSTFSTPVMTPIKQSCRGGSDAHNHDHDEDIRIPFDSKIIDESNESNKLSIELEISTKDSHSTTSSVEAKHEYSDSGIKEALIIAEHHHYQQSDSLMISAPLSPSRFAEATTEEFYSRCDSRGDARTTHVHVY